MEIDLYHTAGVEFRAWPEAQPPPQTSLSTLAPGFARNIGSFVGPGIGPGGTGGEPVNRTGFSGFALDAANKRILFGTGGGHGDHGTLNDIRILDLATLQWSRTYAPTEPADMIAANVTPHCGWNVPGAVPNPRPTQRHLYNGNVVIGDTMWMLAATNSTQIRLGDGSSVDVPNFNNQIICGYNFSTGQWRWSSHVGVIGAHYSCGAAEWQGKALVISPWSDCWLFDPVADTVTGLPFNSGFGTPSIVFYPPTAKHYAVHIDNRPIEYGGMVWDVREIDMAAQTATRLTMTNAPADLLNVYPSFSFDPVNGDIGGMAGTNIATNPGVSVYHRLNVQTKAWRSEIMQVEAGSQGAPLQAFFCSARDVVSGCLIFVDFDGNTWAYRPR